MLRITLVESLAREVRLRVEGRLTGSGVEALWQSCELHALTQGLPLSLDLMDISFADAGGIDLLRELRRRNVVLLNSSPFLEIRIREDDGGALTWKSNDAIGGKTKDSE